MPIVHKKQKQMQPVRVLVVGFAVVICIGTVLLLLPVSTREGITTSFIDALFTATSATCVTGITVLDTYTNFTTFGHVVIMVLLQIGGIGLLTFVTFFNIMIGRKMGLVQSKDLSSEHSLGGFTELKGLVSRVLIYSFTIEIIGALPLLHVFMKEHGQYGIFMAFFMAISAFCNGGFNLYGINNPMPDFPYMNYPAYTIAVMFLITLGGLGFAVWHNIVEYRKTRKLSMHTRIVLRASGILVLFGTVVYFILIVGNPDYSMLSLKEKIVGSLFTSVSARTAGFHGYGFASNSELTELFTMLLMFIGGAPGSTAGGIKVTTFVILIATIFTVLKGREDTVILKHVVIKETVYKSITVLCLSLFFLTSAFAVIYLMHREYRPVDILFEVTSAFTTTGLSNGFSIKSNIVSKLILIFTMFTGRIGPISLILSLTLGKKPKDEAVYPQSTILVG